MQPSVSNIYNKCVCTHFINSLKYNNSTTINIATIYLQATVDKLLDDELRRRGLSIKDMDDEHVRLYYYFDLYNFAITPSGNDKVGYLTRYVDDNGKVVQKMFVGVVGRKCLTDFQTSVRWKEYDIFYRRRKELFEKGEKWNTSDVYDQCKKEINAMRTEQDTQELKRLGYK